MFLKYTLGHCQWLICFKSDMNIDLCDISALYYVTCLKVPPFEGWMFAEF